MSYKAEKKEMTEVAKQVIRELEAEVLEGKCQSFSRAEVTQEAIRRFLAKLGPRLQ